jgi:germination protein M
MKNRLILPLVFILTLLCACARDSGGNDGTVAVYRLSCEGEGKTLVSEQVALREGETPLEAVVRGLNSEPESPELEKAFPDGAFIEDCYIRNGRAQVHVSEGYGSLTGLERTCADYAMACSMAMLDEVCMADIILGSHVLEYSVRADNVLFGDRLCGATQKICKLFLPDDEMQQLESRTLVISSGAGTMAEQVASKALEALDAVPDSTRLLSASVENGVCTLELSEEFYATEPASAQRARLVIGAIVDSVCFLADIDSVIILVNGAPITSYGGYATEWPAKFDSSIVRR